MKKMIIIIFLMLLVFILSILSIFLSGTAKSITVEDVKNFILYGTTGDKFKDTILWDVRIPPLITAIIVGGVLSVAGLILQTLFRNILASPYTTGISSGAILGVAISIFLGLSLPSFFDINKDIIGGWIGSGLALIVLLYLAIKLKDTTGVLVCTLLFSYLYYGVESYLISFADNTQIQEFWMFLQSSFFAPKWKDLKIMAISSIIFLLSTYLLSKQLNALLFVENYAKSFGINIKHLIVIILFLSGFIVGVIIPLVGIIPFIGLASPYIARIIMNTSDHRWTIPASILIGILISLICYLISIKLFAPKVIPVKSILDLFGGMLVIYLIYRAEKRNIINL